jgi:hypothetical protein
MEANVMKLGKELLSGCRTLSVQCRRLAGELQKSRNWSPEAQKLEPNSAERPENVRQWWNKGLERLQTSLRKYSEEELGAEYRKDCMQLRPLNPR